MCASCAATWHVPLILPVLGVMPAPGYVTCWWPRWFTPDLGQSGVGSCLLCLALVYTATLSAALPSRSRSMPLYGVRLPVPGDGTLPVHARSDMINTVSQDAKIACTQQAEVQQAQHTVMMSSPGPCRMAGLPGRQWCHAGAVLVAHENDGRVIVAGVFFPQEHRVKEGRNSSNSERSSGPLVSISARLSLWSARLGILTCRPIAGICMAKAIEGDMK